MKKLILGTFIIVSCFSFSEESSYKDFSMKDPVIRTGLKEAEENISRNFIFNQGDMYRIYAREGFLTTILLQPGEEVEFLGGGDTSRWAIEQAITGSNEGERTAIYIKPFQQEIKTNLVINTNKRQYHFFLQSAKNYYNPLISFLYPRESQLKYKIQKLKDEKQLTPVNTEDLFFGYKINHSRYKIAPSQVFDDGNKTFLIMKKEIKSSEAPVIYVEDPLTGDIALVNYRIKGNYYIIDRIFDKAIIKLGKKEVKIKRTINSNRKRKDNIKLSGRRGEL